MASLYVHIPFCRSICPYCDFPKVLYRDEWASSYLDALFGELNERANGKYDTIFVGGGTPTCLSGVDLYRLLSFLRPYLAENGEFTVEANPDSLNSETVRIFKRNGVNRVSLGAQSSVPALLKTLGRTHDFTKVKEAVWLLRFAGITNINVDFMYGIPGQDDALLYQDIKAICELSKLGVPHYSCYSLILEEGTVYAAKGIKPLEDDVAIAYFHRIETWLCGAMAYRRYEISNFALRGYECKHNLAYWNDEDYLGVGLGAASKLGGVRYTDTKNLATYLRGEYIASEERLSEQDLKEEFFLTTLRKDNGFALEEYQRRFGVDFLVEKKESVEKLVSSGLLFVNSGRVYPTHPGRDLLDRILVDLF